MKAIISSNLLFLFLTSTTSSNGNFTDPTIHNGSLFCVDLPINDVNRTFCGITTKWEPRIKKIGGIFACSILTLVSLVLTVLTVIQTRKKMRRIYADKTAFNAYLGYILFYGKLIWDVVDVALDSSLFYQFEFGHLIDENITRNNHVNNSILAFAAIGSVKLVLFHLPFNHDNEDQDPLSEIKQSLIWQGFFLEDGSELILEYFYIEKYVTLRPPWYLFARDIILALIPVYIVCNSCKSFIDKCESDNGRLDRKNALLFIISIFQYPNCISLVGLLMFLRALGAGYQYITGNLTRGCFKVNNGMLSQTPFSPECLRGIDYAIIVLGCILILILFIDYFLKALWLRFSQGSTESPTIIIFDNLSSDIPFSLTSNV